MRPARCGCITQQRLTLQPRGCGSSCGLHIGRQPFPTSGEHGRQTACHPGSTSPVAVLAFRQVAYVAELLSERGCLPAGWHRVWLGHARRLCRRRLPPSSPPRQRSQLLRCSVPHQRARYLGSGGAAGLACSSVGGGGGALGAGATGSAFTAAAASARCLCCRTGSHAATNCTALPPVFHSGSYSSLLATEGAVSLLGLLWSCRATALLACLDPF